LNHDKATAYYYLGLFQLNVINGLAKDYLTKCLIENANYKKAIEVLLAIQSYERYQRSTSPSKAK
jgi:hypothetical protein